jgi:hypothetical protein
MGVVYASAFSDFGGSLDDATGYDCRIHRCCICSGFSVAALHEQHVGSGLWATSVRQGPTWPLPTRIACWIACRDGTTGISKFGISKINECAANGARVSASR